MSFDQDQIREIIAQAMMEFGAAYSIGFVKALVKKIEFEIEGAPRPPLALLEKPPTPEYYKEGWITKKGAIVKNWKKRWFTVDKDYRVSYWLSEKDPHEKDIKTGKPKKKPKGTFTCQGYKCKKDQDKESKEHQMQLKPYWDDDYIKRTWCFQFSSQEDFDLWKKMFQECISQCPNPMHSDPVRRKAFEFAYTEMEHYWYFYPTGSEEEMLAYVVMRRCERLVLNDFYEKLPAGSLRWKIIEKTRGTVGGMIAPAVGAAWKSAQEAVDKIEKPTEDKLRQAVGPLFQAIKFVKHEVQASFQLRIIPVIVQLMAPVAEKFIPSISLPLVKAQKELIEEFINHAADESRDSWRLYWELRKRDDAYNTALSLAVSVMEDSSELQRLPEMILDSCYELLADARFNYYHVDDKQIDLTCAKLLHDCLKEQHRILTWLVELLVLKPFNESLGGVLNELCSLVEECVPEALREFLSPADVIKSMGSVAMQSAIQACITAGDQSSVPERIAGYFTSNGVVVDTRRMAEMAHAKQAKKDEGKKP